MKSFVFSILLFLSLTACTSSISAKNSREKLLKYRKEGYSVRLNDSVIRIDQLILDENKMEEILVDKFDKIVTIKYSESLNVVPAYWTVKSNEKDKLLIIDGVPIRHEELDSLKIEMSAFNSIQVKNETINHFGRQFKKVIRVNTKTTTANSRFAH
ncbi:hypothetical protein WMW71_06115 [Flavobacterium buctense]|uniref:Uncharacterized protein n=1 Tax=Flavobacterium buctense TaxID=1648146 RepID=A0ABU9E1W6_9FLAO|nr:hypothetical protein [Flavobacterium buctense]